MEQATNSVKIESVKDYPKTPQGKQAYWSDELTGAKNMLNTWHIQADAIHDYYLDQRANTSTRTLNRTSAANGFRLNLFYSNVQTVMSVLYGRLPKVDVRRRFSDAQDDTGRVASVIMGRILEADMTDNPTQYSSVLRAVLEDRLVPGLGCARVRYDIVTETIEIEATTVEDSNVVPLAQATETVIKAELAPMDYYHWRDVLWSWARTPADLRWMAFRTFITKDEATERYGKEKTEQLTFKVHKLGVNDQTAPSDPDDDDYWLKAEIWEIWCKETRTIYDYSEGALTLLRKTPDPLQLPNFFPAPTPLIANATTSLFKPTPDFHFQQDLYHEIDKLQTRIAVITEAVRVVGVYDSSIPELQQMLKRGVDNKLIPVEKAALLAEKGGLEGVIDWFPIGQVVEALLQLRQLRDETIELLYQISGMADVMRGALSNQYEGVGQTDDKVKFGSARIQKLQEDFATFVTELMSIKAQVIARHFDPETIYKMANAQDLAETPELIQAAISLIKTPERARLQIKIEAESLALIDYTQIRQERSAFMESLNGFMTAAGPLLEQDPTAAPYLMQMLQWGLAGFRGADEVEGILDKAIEAAAKAAEEEKQNPQPDPDTQKLQLQMQADQQKAQAAQQLEAQKQQGQQQLEQLKAQAQVNFRKIDLRADIDTKAAEHQMEMQALQASTASEHSLIRAKALADMQTEQATSEINAEQQALGVEAELSKDTVTHAQEMEKLEHQAQLKIREAAIVADIKISEDEAIQANKPTTSEE